MSYIQHVVILFAEIIVFSSFVYIVSTRTNEELSRRWKASAFVSVLFGLLIHFFCIVLFVIICIYNANSETLLNDLPNKFKEGLLLLISLATFITMPIIIIGIFIVFFQFRQNGDRLIEKYWRNPKISYREHAKPPYLKF
jgi:NADH:ubiquinone oxidoreductase subunit 6 (subunit J)